MKISLNIMWENNTTMTRGQCGLLSDSCMMKVAWDIPQAEYLKTYNELYYLCYCSRGSPGLRVIILAVDHTKVNKSKSYGH